MAAAGVLYPGCQYRVGVAVDAGLAHRGCGTGRGVYRFFAGWCGVDGGVGVGRAAGRFAMAGVGGCVDGRIAGDAARPRMVAAGGTGGV